MLSAVAEFYDYHARNGVEVARALVEERRSGRGSYKPFWHGIARAKSRGGVGRLGEERRPPRALALDQVRSLIGCQERLRDRLLFLLLALSSIARPTWLGGGP
jgi:integrase/recombinase XerD